MCVCILSFGRTVHVMYSAPSLGGSSYKDQGLSPRRCRAGISDIFRLFCFALLCSKSRHVSFQLTFSLCASQWLFIFLSTHSAFCMCIHNCHFLLQYILDVHCTFLSTRCHYETSWNVVGYVWNNPYIALLA